MGIVPPAPDGGNRREPHRSHLWAESPPPAPGSDEARWLERDAEARQRHEDRELLRRLCRDHDTTEERLGRALLRLLARGIAEIADAGGRSS